ncbi:MAG: hypothetical protein MUF50_02635 [Planctomycetes bacterium]|jgi:phosphoribosylaminoimidazolecarboxamide formyltransferase/IMP cyclohydrolase|nr:hypothetical protein [Planctomycetota bacterium]
MTKKRKTALMSVYYKTEQVYKDALELRANGFTIYASGGTFKFLKQNKVPVKDIAQIAGGGGILGNRVLTISRGVGAGLLAQRVEKDVKEMEELGFPYIDLVYSGLYPLQEEIKRIGSNEESVTKETDIGGILLIRAGGKGRRLVCSRPGHLQKILAWEKLGRPNEKVFLRELAADAEFVAADYSLTSAKYLGGRKYEGLTGEIFRICKYGENPFQTPAIVYENNLAPQNPLRHTNIVKVSGDDPSYNNSYDVDRLLYTVTKIAATFDVNYGKVPFIALGAKHGNCCGVGISDSRSEVIKKMLIGDHESLFGGSVLFNFFIEKEGAELLLNYASDGNQLKLDNVLATGFSEEATALLERKKGKCRMAALGGLATLGKDSLDCHPNFKQLFGGDFMVQPANNFILKEEDELMVKYGELTRRQIDDLLLAKCINDSSNSNTITIVKDGKLLGNGVGQTSRKIAAKLAVDIAQGAGHDLKGAVVASDSFFPFTDALEILINAGIEVVFAPSGSINDKNTIQLAHNKAVVLWMMDYKICRGFLHR